MEDIAKSNKQAEASQNKRYNYIVGIDFGNYSTSFSFVHVDYENDIQTIKYWETNDNNSVPGRVTSSVIYKEEGSVSLWGNSAHKRFYNERDDFFYTPHIKLYLTDAGNQVELPGSLTSVKLLSDYLKQLHEYGVNQMKAYFQKKNEENKVENKVEKEVESTGIAPHGISLSEEGSRPIFSVTEDQIRYIISYPDNQMNGDYIKQMREALEMAGIVSSEDPELRLKYVPESQATAHYCANTSNHTLKPSTKPYLVCDIGGEVFGLSTIIAEELPETGKVEAHIDRAVVGCGNLDIDKNMKRYLADKITASPEDDAILSRVRQELFDFYVDEIKPSFTDEPNGTGDYYHTIMGISSSAIESTLLEQDTFVFSYDDMKSKIFDPVTDSILEHIDNQIKQFDKEDKEISGIFLSGAIGERRYLSNLVKDRFQTAKLRVNSIENSAFAVSEGLIYSGIRERGLMIPYFEKREVKQKQRVLSLGNENPACNQIGSDDIKKINHKDIDYIIGLDFGTTHSGFAYAPVPKNEEEEKKSHTLVIKEIKAWPKQTGGGYPKIPSMLYYNQKMEYQYKFGYEAKNESAKARATGVLLRHFKLLLSRDFNLKVDDKILKKLDDFDIVDAIAHFLKDFNKEGISRMKRSGLKVNEDRLGYIVTIPAMWPDEAKNTMKEAVKRANLFKSKKGESKIDDRLAFITEAEASALYCEKYYKDEFSIEKQQRFMICDAGGGTVDLTTFEVGQEEDSNGKLLISELTSGDGDHCGSLYLDDNFKNYILDNLDKIHMNYTQKGIENLVDLFIREIKPNFEPSLSPNIEDEIELSIPLSLGIPNDFEDDTGFIQGDTVVIPYTEMEKFIFKPVVNKILNLIDRQLRKLPEGERQLDAIILVGRFSQSPYLYQKIADKFERKSVGAMFIGKPPKRDLAVCKGAVLFGLNPIVVSRIITRYTYGLQVKDVYILQDDPPQEIAGYDGNHYSQNVFTEIVAKDIMVNKGTVYKLKTFVIYPNDPIFAIYSVDDKENDRDLRKILNTSDIQPFCKLTAKMPEILGIKEGSKVEFEIMVEITGTDVNVDVLYQGKLLTKKAVTKASTVISEKKYELGSRAEKKKRWGVQFFSSGS